MDNKTYIGCNVPLANSQYGYFNASVTTEEQAASNLKNLLLTRKGERLMHPTFGTNIYSYLFESLPVSDIQVSEFKELIMSDITEAVNFWLPYINIDDIEIKTAFDSDKHLSSRQYNISGLTITIKWHLKTNDINKINIATKQLIITLI